MGKHMKASRLLWVVYLKRLIGPTLKDGLIDLFFFFLGRGIG